jgi:hypothetical protein
MTNIKIEICTFSVDNSVRFIAGISAAANQKTVIITQNGEAKVIVQDIRVYEQTLESLALLKMLALSSKHITQGLYKPVGKTFTDLNKKIKEFHDK